MASFTYRRHIAAPPETVFDVLTEHQRYAAITPMRKSVLEREGDPAPNGVGAIRVLTSVGPPLREEVIAYQPPPRFSYKLLSGAAGARPRRHGRAEPRWRGHRGWSTR